MVYLFGLIHEGQMKPIALLILMLAFGYVQENTKVRLNAYRSVADRSVGFYDLSLEDRNSLTRTLHVPNFIHELSKPSLVKLKWVLSASILLIFFLLDALFLKVSALPGAPSSAPWLVLIYIGVSIPMFAFLFLSPGPNSSSYAVSRELLGFLQSPLPSLLLAYTPRLLKAHLPPFPFHIK
ncbi:MAG: hypothetical protein OSA04_08795 [Flavobacteriales bacterium]|nr:hypothetical protein [Flavobacteriales bacterium]